MPAIVVVIVAVVLVVDLTIWLGARRAIRLNDGAAGPLLLPGRKVAERLVAAQQVEGVSVIVGSVDCYRWDYRRIELADGRTRRSSMSAVTIAAHEAAHAWQHATGWKWFALNQRLAMPTFFAGPIGLAFLVTGIATGWDPLVWIAAGLFTFLGVAGFVTSVIEVDASRWALTWLDELDLVGYDERAARRLLWWCGATYVSETVFDIGAIVRRTTDFGEDLGFGGWGRGDGDGFAGGDGGGSSGCGGGCGGGGGG